MPEEILKTNSQILNRMVEILEQQKRLMELYKSTGNKDYLNSFQVLSSEFHQLRFSLKDAKISK